MFNRMGRQLESGTIGDLQAVPVDLKDHGDEYTLVADLPGYDVDDIDLTYADGNVRIEASRHLESESELDGSYVHRERAESVERNVHVPEAVVEAEITAEYDNGKLMVTLPKVADTTEGHSIDID
jgi:HSP20 family protein